MNRRGFLIGSTAAVVAGALPGVAAAPIIPLPRDYVLSWYTKVKGDNTGWTRVFNYITEHQARGILEVGAYPLPVPRDAYCIQLDQAPPCSNYENEERAGLNLLTDSNGIAWSEI